MAMSTDDLCALSAATYAWKPMQAFFSVLTLRTYLSRPLAFESPILDLGCSDGLFGSLLSKVHGNFVVDAGFDIDGCALKRAASGRVHRCRVARADARALPYRSASFATIFSNGVLCCVPGGIDAPLHEASRVLRPGGSLIFTMPTPAFTEILAVPRLLRWFGLGRSAKRYVDRMNARLHHVTAVPEEALRDKIESAGLRVDEVRGFFTPREGRVWDVLSLHPWRVFGLMRVIPWAGGPLRAILRLCLRRFYRRGADAGEFGYLLIRATKPA